MTSIAEFIVKSYMVLTIMFRSRRSSQKKSNINWTWI